MCAKQTEQQVISLVKKKQKWMYLEEFLHLQMIQSRTQSSKKSQKWNAFSNL